jgi:hypothetical protein
MSLNQPITFERTQTDDELSQGTALSQDHETFHEMQCFGFDWQHMPYYRLPWEWSICSSIDYDASSFPIPSFEPASNGQKMSHLLEGGSLMAPLSLIWENEPSHPLTEVPLSPEAFELATVSVSCNLQLSDPVQLPSGPSTSTQVLGTTDSTANIQENSSANERCYLDEPVSSRTLDPPKTEVFQPNANALRRGNHGKSSERGHVLSATKDQQRRERKKGASFGKEKDDRIKVERHRRAAAKCRERKRDLVNALNSEIKELRDRQQQLSLSYNQLRSEAVRLKAEVLRHGDCDCDFIRRYISAEANRTVERAERHGDCSSGSKRLPTQTLTNLDSSIGVTMIQ